MHSVRIELAKLIRKHEDNLQASRRTRAKLLLYQVGNSYYTACCTAAVSRFPPDVGGTRLTSAGIERAGCDRYTVRLLFAPPLASPLPSFLIA